MQKGVLPSRRNEQIKPQEIVRDSTNVLHLPPGFVDIERS
jgi:hypothetical protein